MRELSRRSAVMALGATLVSGAAAGAWLTKGPGEPTRAGQGGGAVFAGAVTLLGSRRQPLHAGHHGWSETVVADLEVHNPNPRSILVSPGQFRLRVGENGPSVTFYDSERRIGVLPAGRRVRLWVSYLAPPEPTPLSLEYTGAGAATPLRIALAPTEVPS